MEIEYSILLNFYSICCKSLLVQAIKKTWRWIALEMDFSIPIINKK